MIKEPLLETNLAKGEEKKNFSTLLKDSSTLFYTALAPMTGTLLHPLYQMMNQIFMKDLENATEKQAALGLAMMLLNLFMNGVIIAFSISLSTLISQANGQGNRKLCQLYLRRQQILQTLIFLPLAAILLFSKKISQNLGQREEISEMAETYILITLPGFYFLNQNGVQAQYCSSMKKFSLPLYATFLAYIFYFIAYFVFVKLFQLDFVGISIITTLQFFLRWFFLHIIIQNSEIKVDSSYTYRELFENLYFQFKFCFLGSFSFLLPFWSQDIFTLIASQLSTNYFAAQAIVWSITFVTFMAPVGLAIVSQISVGQLIGASKVQEAQYAAKVGVFSSFMLNLTLIFTLNVFKNQFLSLFTEEKDVLEIIDTIWIHLNLQISLNIFGRLFTGIIRGLALQAKASIIPLFGFWFFGIPLAFYLTTYQGLKLQGIWLGQVLANLIVFLGSVILIYGLADWRRQARIAHERSQKN